MDEIDRPLADIRVVEFAQMVAAPSAGLLLADYGADVIKIEPRDGDSCRYLKTRAAADLPVSPVFLAYNRSKRLIRLDLREEADRAVAFRLLEEADVVIEASLPGAMDRLGFGAAALMAANPRLIYASVSGFGWVGAGRDKRGVDLIVQAESGIMSVTGPPETPMKVGFTMVDAACGHALCHGILAALYRRTRTGRGDHVRVSLYDVGLHLQSGPLVEFLMTGVQPPRSGNSAPLSAPADLLRCAEGSIVVSAYLPPHWIILTDTLGCPALRDDPRFATPVARLHNRAALVALLEERLASKTAAAWLPILERTGLLVGEVKDYSQVMAASFTAESGIVAAAGGTPAIHNPAQLASVGRAAPKEQEELSAADIRWLLPRAAGDV